MSNQIDLAIALTATGLNIPEVGQEGMRVKVAEALQPGQLFDYLPDTPIRKTFATHTARDADVTAYLASDLGSVARVTADGTLWQLTAITPEWSPLAHPVGASLSGDILLTSGTQVVDLPLELGYEYDIEAHVRAANGAGGIEYSHSLRCYAYRPDATAVISAQETILTNSAASWATVLSVSTSNIRCTTTNTSGSTRVGKTELAVRRVGVIPI